MSSPNILWRRLFEETCFFLGSAYPAESVVVPGFTIGASPGRVFPRAEIMLPGGCCSSMAASQVDGLIMLFQIHSITYFQKMGLLCDSPQGKGVTDIVAENSQLRSMQTLPMRNIYPLFSILPRLHPFLYDLTPNDGKGTDSALPTNPANYSSPLLVNSRIGRQRRN